VAEVGARARGVAVGDRVAVQTLFPCGRCAACRDGLISCCTALLELGSIIDGGWQELIAVPAYAAHPIPDRMPLAEAALTEPSANALAVVRRAGVRASDRVVVVGPGAIGLLALQYARLRHPRRIVVVGRAADAGRLELARRLGADTTIAEDSTEAALAAVMEATDGEGADAVLQCAGAVEATELAVACAGLNGRVVVEGVVGSRGAFPIEPDSLVIRNLTVSGMRGWRLRDFIDALELNGRGLVDLGPLITHRLRLEDFETGFALTRDVGSGAIKVAFEPAGDGALAAA
jgi:threonine dehydrogenase-like Zn-dependent dehydrogenase